MRGVFPGSYLRSKGLRAELVHQIAEEAYGNIITAEEARGFQSSNLRQRERMMAEANAERHH